MSEAGYGYDDALAAARLAARTPGSPRLVWAQGRSLGQPYVTAWSGQVAPGRLVALLSPGQFERLRAQLAGEGIHV